MMRALRRLAALARRHASALCLAGLVAIPVGAALVLYTASLAGAGLIALGFLVTGLSARAAGA